MKRKGFYVGLALLAVGLAVMGCQQKGTIPSDLKVRDPEELDKATASAVEEVEEAVVGVPLSPRDFGVPTYPGAQSVHTQRLGSPDQDGEYKMVQVATPDPAERVTDFYQRELRAEVQRQPVSQGNSALFVWYQGPRVGQTLLIAEDGKGKTIVTVSRTEMNKENPLMLDTSTIRPEGKMPSETMGREGR
jgi:hypothetical protein